MVASMTSPPQRPAAEPSLADIEAEWRGKPVGPSATTARGFSDQSWPVSRLARRINVGLLVLLASLYAVGFIGLVSQASPALIFTAVGSANFVSVLVALRTRRVLGLAFRGRLIARREHEPVLYWASLALFAITGGFLLFAVAAVLLSP
jgi:hypothetical protein